MQTQRSLNFITLWMLLSLLWCLENPNFNAQWNFNGRSAPARSVCYCLIKMNGQKSVFKYRQEIVSAYSGPNRILKWTEKQVNKQTNKQIKSLVLFLTDLSNNLKSWPRIRHHKKLSGKMEKANGKHKPYIKFLSIYYWNR